MRLLPLAFAAGISFLGLSGVGLSPVAKVKPPYPIPSHCGLGPELAPALLLLGIARRRALSFSTRAENTRE